MGIIPRPFEEGYSCPICFDYQKTPKYLKCFISGVQIGNLWEPGMPPPPNGYHDLITQSPLYCQWVIDKPGPYGVVLKLFDTYSRLIAWGAPPDLMFEHTRDERCVFSFTNKWLSPDGRYYYGGYAYVTVPGDIKGEDSSPLHPLSSVINSVTPLIDPDPRMECFPIEEGEIVVRYAGKRDATNIAIKFDTNP